MNPARHDTVIARTREWLEQVVIGLNLCPFARKPLQAGRVRFAVSDSRTIEALLHDLQQELERLQQAGEDVIDTTLLIIPGQLHDFYDYNDMLDLAEGLLEQQGWSGSYQLASFHPAYQFAGTAVNDRGNFTNRAPYPVLHLLRETSLDKGLASYPDPEQIPERNIVTLQTLSDQQWRALFGRPPGDAS
ncbi:MAG: DUF1415 domain-containing protein [Alcanivorax sp.]|nr:DUF1415 domain-containing protein [Alcanivorax sp.]